VAAVATCLFRHGCNILDAQQFDSLETGQFFARIVFDRVGAAENYEALRADFSRIAEEFSFVW
ncbi:MAG: formyltetrahydrofolate deformylase, partial [Hyphomicrobiales bacterium]|nr:formyltetrahydrofolate deformylase [Hyphomicrobiales bacterium]